MSAIDWGIGIATRYHPIPHPHGSGGGFLSTFLHSVVASIGWQAGMLIARMLGVWLIPLAIVAAVVYLAVWLKRRKPSRRSTARRSTARRSTRSRRTTARGRR